MVHCAVFGCAATPQRNPDRSFHEVPSDKRIKRMWIYRLNRKDWVPCAGARVCSYHFNVEDFTQKRQSDTPVEFQKKRLKKNAIPSCNLRGEKEDARLMKGKTNTSPHAMNLLPTVQGPSYSSMTLDQTLAPSQASNSIQNKAITPSPPADGHIVHQHEFEKIKGEIEVAVLVNDNKSQAQQLNQLIDWEEKFNQNSHKKKSFHETGEAMAIGTSPSTALEHSAHSECSSTKSNILDTSMHTTTRPSVHFRSIGTQYEFREKKDFSCQVGQSCISYVNVGSD